MKLELNRYLMQLASVFLPAILMVSSALAGGQTEMLIEVKTDDFQLEQLDISHLEVGDSETIYTEDGTTVDILRAVHGVEIFIDGEKLDIPSPHDLEFTGDAQKHHEIMIEIECDSAEDDGCTNHHYLSDSPEFRNAEHHKVIIVKEFVHEDDEI
jgi:hypothetical protein